MPRIIALLPHGVSMVDLGHFSCRLDIGVSMVDKTPALSLVYRYPPSPAAIMHPQGTPISLEAWAQTTLVRSPVEITDVYDAVKRIADVALHGGTLEADMARTTEAYKMFNNMQNARKETIESLTKEGLEVIRAYWFVREWLGTGAAEKNESTFLGTRLLCLPT